LSTTYPRWLEVVLTLLTGALLVGPAIATLFAWNCDRKDRPRCVRLARIAMAGSALSIVSYVMLVAGHSPSHGTPPPWFSRKVLLETPTVLVALFQALIFTMAWLATREPRALRRDCADGE
jgi:hypothetical protein